MATCKECNGSGGTKCPPCKGDGRVVDGIFRTNWKECTHCNGSGKKKCGVCNGKGTV